MSEHRREVRQRTFLKGRILFNKGASSMDCLVRDMSASGARLALTETSTLPDSFELYIPQKDKTYRSTLAWRRADGVGIAFALEAAPASAPAPAEDTTSLMALMRRVSELEAENAALRRLLMGAPVAAAGTAMGTGETLNAG
ncbi:MAG: PilZ domain-containing protein [Methylobacterium sp.]|uniref:PilZ domain-containing protein n=1 Tax=unclassified Methylobacterium TaxID=2615210 RepID=UPI0006FE0C0A|nr:MULTISPECIES: PilZ domain-containing protein [unclassified Methylobacterium]KQP06558.1 pilus assembly protein PilZ [Methylobacterium sp. Leaf99]MDO9425618.1 PilZ domain-containing protein [Methylobacterium sp.]TXM75777.1 PilZ domain-containing protein [Methylobacterium sp. WL69]